MAHTLFKVTYRLTNAQTSQLYDLAEKAGVGICLWQDTAGPASGKSVWGVDGSFWKVIKFLRVIRKVGWTK
jgi:hypothetical protein